jgi:hypothetical protein
MDDAFPTSPSSMSMKIKNTFIEFFDYDGQSQEESMSAPILRKNASEPLLQTGVLFSAWPSKVLFECPQKKIEFVSDVECPVGLMELLEPEWEPEIKPSTTDVETIQTELDICEQMGAECKFPALGVDNGQKRRRRRRRGSLIDVAYWDHKKQETAVRFCQWCGGNCDERYNFCRFCGRSVQ